MINKTVRNVLILTVCIIALGLFVFAGTTGQYEEQANQLQQLGLLKGSSTGFDLLRAPKRVEAAVMLVRLLGKETEVLEGTYLHPFKDVPDWAQKYIGYMYQNGLTKGKTATTFGSDDLTDAKSYVTFVLRALGYNDSQGDFSWANALTFATEKGVLSKSDATQLSGKTFLRDDMVLISTYALNSNLKNGSEQLINKLIQTGAVTQASADQFELFTQSEYDQIVTPKIKEISDMVKGARVVPASDIGWSNSDDGFKLFDLRGVIKDLNVQYVETPSSNIPWNEDSVIESLLSAYGRDGEYGNFYEKVNQPELGITLSKQNEGATPYDQGVVMLFFDESKRVVAYSILDKPMTEVEKVYKVYLTKYVYLAPAEAETATDDLFKEVLKLEFSIKVDGNEVMTYKDGKFISLSGESSEATLNGGIKRDQGYNYFVRLYFLNTFTLPGQNPTIEIIGDNMGYKVELK